MTRLSFGACINVVLLLFFAALFSGLVPSIGEARNINTYSDLITDSRPLAQSNHTFTFTIKEDIAPSGYIDVAFPADFEFMSTSTFGIRNIELLVNGTTRVAGLSATGVSDGIALTAGLGGGVVYTLNSNTGLSAEDTLELRIGNHTLNAIEPSVSYSTSTGTTTDSGDIEPIINSSVVGTHKIAMNLYGGVDSIEADFSIAVIDAIATGDVDTTETVPPRRFNGAPDGEIGGTTLSADISLETDELAFCRWSTASGTPFLTNPNVMDNTGLRQHSQLVAIIPESLNTFYVRCIDDEGNYNIDDFLIAFLSPPPPDGTPNADGEVEGDGTGTGDSGTGGGTGSGETSSGSDGSGSTDGNTSGGGGSSGGSGSGGSGDDEADVAGGGFESSDGPYRSGDAQVIINGYAFPGSTVYAVVDGFIAEDVRAGSDGKYSITVEEIARGAYTFGVYAVDDNDVKSTTFSTSFTVTGGRTSSLSNINIVPSVLVTPDPVNPGDSLTISGYSIPDATITIENQQDGLNISQKVFTTTSDGDGEWSIPVDTGSFSQGTYKVKAKAEALDDSVSTGYSDYTFYGVGQEAEGQINADLNRDGSINLTDFSILLFWWGGDGGDSSPPADINGDGSVSLTDFSIMLFQWTG
jgi:uncharacterized membrane protein YgcG